MTLLGFPLNLQRGCVEMPYVDAIEVYAPLYKNRLSQEEVVSERPEQPKEQQKKRLTAAEIYKLAAEIYESLPEGQEDEAIEALCNMVGRTAIEITKLEVRTFGF